MRRPDAGQGGGGRIAVSVLLVLLVAVGLLLLVRARPDTGPFDPRSNRPDGARALVLLLEQQGASVDLRRDAPEPGDEARVIVLADALDDATRERLVAFVEAGGVAVVADPESPLHGGSSAGAVEVSAELPAGAVAGADAQANVDNEQCSIAALAHLRGLFVRDGVLFTVGSADATCFADGGGHAFAIRRDLGGGAIVGLGDNRLLTNELLRFADNSGLAVALLVPNPGSRVVVLESDRAARAADEIGEGDDSLGELIRPSVWMGIVQLVLAFAVLALARGVRTGRVVDEPLPSPLEGSDAVRARATMMQRARHAAHAAALLRSELHRDLTDRYHLPPTATVDEIDDAAVQRDGIEPGRVRRVLPAGPYADVVDEARLVDLATAIARLRADLARATVAGTAPGGRAP